MGFYSPATLLRDGKRRGLKFKPVSVLHSQWKCTIEATQPNDAGRPLLSIRLGFCLVLGLNTAHAKRIPAERTTRPYTSLHDFRTRVQLDKDELRVLARIGALNGLADHRRSALWRVEEAVDPEDLFSWAQSHPCAASNDTAPDQQPLNPMTPSERIHADYQGTGLTVGPHPMSLVRAELPHVWRAADLPHARHGDQSTIAGNVICRQRPGTAKGFVFISLEDESGISNAIVSPQLFEKLRLLITQESFLVISGCVQNVDNVVLIRTTHIQRLGEAQLQGTDSHDFH